MTTDVQASSWRLVEVGRVVLFTTGPFEGKLATITEIIDHKRVRAQLRTSESPRIPKPPHSIYDL